MAIQCDSCGRPAGTPVEKEFTRTTVQLGWPPIRRVSVEELWCQQCHVDSYADGHDENRHN